jgi:superfamily I DNA and/or RNA helicase
MFKIAQKCHPNIVATLDTQYRMHEQIMNTINQFYKRDVEGGLKCGIKEDMDKKDWSLSGSRWHGLTFDKVLTPEKHAIWINVDTPETALNPGFKNKGEVKAIEYVLKMLKSADGFEEYMAAQKSDEDKEIGVITFYSGQKKAIRDAKLDSSFKFRISAVDKFQGMERNIVIVSTVRSNHEKNIGFARESERINVAFSRAKRLLIVVGNKKLFSKFEDYRESIDNMRTVEFSTLKNLLK